MGSAAQLHTALASAISGFFCGGCLVVSCLAGMEVYDVTASYNPCAKVSFLTNTLLPVWRVQQRLQELSAYSACCFPAILLVALWLSKERPGEANML